MTDPEMGNQMTYTEVKFRPLQSTPVTVKCFQEKCDYKRSVTLSGVTQISGINTRKSIFIA